MDEADVTCPYCGETVTIQLESDGGSSQEYVQDCEVCCQPWRVLVRYRRSREASVSVERAQ